MWEAGLCVDRVVLAYATFSSKPWEYPGLRSEINSAGGYPFLIWRGMLGLEHSLGIGPFMYVSVVVEG